MIIGDDLWPVTIVKDRYHGTYSGADWLAFPTYPEVVAETNWDGDDFDCDEYFSKERPIGKGATPHEALADLKRIMEARQCDGPLAAKFFTDK